MKTVIQNATIIPMASKEAEFITGDLVLEDELILQVGGVYAPAQGDRVIDGTAHIVIPGLINGHTHLPMTLLRNCADDMDLFTWLNDHIWPREEKHTPETILWGSYLGLLELIQSGVTTFSDMYFMQEQTIAAVLQSGIGAHIGATIMGNEGETRKRLPMLRELHASWQGAQGGRIRIDVAPHAIYTCDAQTLRIAAELTEEFDTAMHIHVSETAKEQDDALGAHGMTPLAYLDSLGVLQVPVYAAHGVFFTPGDINLCRDKKVSVIHNPSSNLKLGNGCAPIHELQQSGVSVGLGTDGASSNNNLNMMEEMHLTSLIHKGWLADPRLLNAYQVLAMATREGARALFRDDIGTLEPGKRADIVMVSTESPHMTPLLNPVAALVYSAQSSDISRVFSSGRAVYESGDFTTLDKEKICAEAESCARALQ